MRIRWFVGLFAAILTGVTLLGCGGGGGFVEPEASPDSPAASETPASADKTGEGGEDAQAPPP